MNLILDEKNNENENKNGKIELLIGKDEILRKFEKSN